MFRGDMSESRGWSLLTVDFDIGDGFERYDILSYLKPRSTTLRYSNI